MGLAGNHWTAPEEDRADLSPPVLAPLSPLPPAAIVAARDDVAKGMLEAQNEPREVEEIERVEEERAKEAWAVLEREQREREEDVERAKAREEIERVSATPVLRRCYTTRMHVPKRTHAPCRRRRAGRHCHDLHQPHPSTYDSCVRS